MLWHGWEEFERSALFRRIAAFQEAYPEVQFDVQYIPMLDLQASFLMAAQDGAAPTILIGPAEWGPALYDRQFLADLSPLASPDLLDSLNPAALNTGRYRGALIGLPFHMNGVVLYRNKTIIPKAPATFEELVQLSQAAMRGEVIGAILERGFFYSAGHLYGLGGELMTPAGDPAFDQDGFRSGVTWLNLMKSFEQAGPTEYLTDNDLNLFIERRAGFIIESTSKAYDLVGAIEPLNLAIDPWPSYESGNLAGFVQAENLYLTPRALQEEDQVSWLFFQWLLTPDSQRALSDVNLVPAISSAPEVGAIDKIGNPFAAQSMIALENGATYPIIPEMAVYNTYLDIALQTVIFQAADPLTALQAAYDAIQAALPGLRAAQTPSP